MGTYYLSLLHSSLPQRVDLSFVQTSTHDRTASESGRLTLRNIIEAFKDCARFTKSLMKHKPHLCDICTAFGLSFLKHSVCILIARLGGSRILLHPHCSLSSLYHEHSRLWRWYFRQVIRQTDGVIALSKEWKSLSNIIPGHPVFYLPNAIDTKPYAEIASQRRSLHPNPNVFHILYLGNLGQSKGSFDLLAAAKLLSEPEIQFVFDLVGNDVSPGEKNQLCKQVQDMGLWGIVSIHPAATGPDKIERFRAADIFVYPSHGEGMPLAVIEAMASGLPVIATNVGGLPDLVSEGINGILVEPGSPKDLSQGILQLARNPKLMETMQKNSTKIALAQYDIEQHINGLIDVYKKTAHVL